MASRPLRRETNDVMTIGLKVSDDGYGQPLQMHLIKLHLRIAVCKITLQNLSYVSFFVDSQTANM